MFSATIPESRLDGETPSAVLASPAEAGGVAPGVIGLAQFNLEIPDLPPGDHAIEIEVGGITGEQGLYLAIGHQEEA